MRKRCRVLSDGAVKIETRLESKLNPFLVYAISRLFVMIQRCMLLLTIRERVSRLFSLISHAQSLVIQNIGHGQWTWFKDWHSSRTHNPFFAEQYSRDASGRRKELHAVTNWAREMIPPSLRFALSPARSARENVKWRDCGISSCALVTKHQQVLTRALNISLFFCFRLPIFGIHQTAEKMKSWQKSGLLCNVPITIKYSGK